MSKTTTKTTKKKINSKNYEEMLPYKMEPINSARITTEKYQRKIDKEKVRHIVSEFDERIANEPKLSFRDGKYYCFDGQHTIAARKALNKGKNLDIVCKVFYDLDQSQEALLFAAQTGSSSKPTSGTTLNAQLIGNDSVSQAFVDATEAAGIETSYIGVRGKCRLRCINTAKKLFVKFGEKKYIEALRVANTAWQGKPNAFYADVLKSICEFVSIYDGDYNYTTLVQALDTKNPYEIALNVKLPSVNSGRKNALTFILDAYNSIAEKTLPIKF